MKKAKQKIAPQSLPAYAIPLMLVAITILLQLAQLHYGTPITSDAFERMRIAEGLQQGIAPQWAAIGAENNAYNYPPLFDYLLASTSALMGISTFKAINALSLLFGAALFLLAFVFSRHLFGEKIAIFSAIAISLSPWLAWRTITPISETLGIFLFALSILLFLKKKNELCLISLLALFLAHYRSLAVTLLALLLIAVFSKRIFEFAKIAALPAILFAFFVPKTAFITNPWVIEPNIFEYFSPALIALSIGGAAVLASKAWNKKTRKEIWFPTLALASMAFAALALSLVAPFPFRQTVYLVFPAAILAGAMAEFAFAQAERFGTLAKAGLAILLLAAIFATHSSTLASKAAPFNADEAKLFSALKYTEGKSVVAPFNYNYAIPYYSGKKVAVGAFAEGLPDGQARVNDLWEFYRGAGTQRQKEILQKYGAQIICLDLKRFSEKEFEGVLGNKIVSNGNAACFGAAK